MISLTSACAPERRGSAWYTLDAMAEAVPDSVRRLFWDVDPEAVNLDEHADYVLERVMTRGTWEAMCWLRARYSKDAIADFLRRRGDRLPPRDRAYWALVSGEPMLQQRGGGRPTWAG